MKIGIISINMYSKGQNFACPLHNYAFQQFLLKHDIENTIISYTPIYFNDFDLRHPADYYTRLCENFEKQDRVEKEPEEWARITGLRHDWSELYEERERRYDKFQHFIDTHYIKTDRVYNCDLLEVEDPGFDCYICCTDVIWKKEPYWGFDRGFFLASTAMENKWKISYAASRGVFFSENEADEQTFLHYVEDIDAISVREASLKHYLEENIEKPVTQVLDPVLLHEKEFYDSIIIKPEVEHYIFLYYVMEKANDTAEKAVEYARAHNLKIVEITDRPLKHGKLSEYSDIEVIYRYDMGIEEWLGYIKYADYIFTNSFHCCCFSILFEKQLFVGKRAGDKVSNVLEMFGLMDRRFQASTDLIGHPLPDIDYSKVTPIMEQKRKESADFILSAIHRMEQEQRPVQSYEWWKRSLTYPITYCAESAAGITKALSLESGELTYTYDGLPVFQSAKKMGNNGLSRFASCMFFRPGYQFNGWRMRFRIDTKWFWYLKDGSFVLVDEYNETKHSPIRIFQEHDRIPYIPVNGIASMQAIICWKNNSELYPLSCYSNYHASSKDYHLDSVLFDVRTTGRGFTECFLHEPVQNNGQQTIPVPEFSRDGYELSGWYIRLKFHGQWYWYLENGTFQLCSDYQVNADPTRYLLTKGSPIPALAVNHIEQVRLDAVWEETFSNKIKRKFHQLLK